MLAIIELGPFALEHPSGLIATILGLVLLVVLAKPLGKFLGLPQPSVLLADRSRQIETDTLQVERQLQDVAQMRNDYAGRIQAIEIEQRERIAAAVRDADNARADIIAEAEETARALRRRGEEEMERERTRQRILLRQHIVQTTLDAAEQAIKAQNSDAVQRQLIRDFTVTIANSGSNGAHAVSATAAMPPQAVTNAPSAGFAPVSPAPPAAIPMPAASVSPSTHGATAYNTPAVPAPPEDTTNGLPDFSAFNAADHITTQGEA